MQRPPIPPIFDELSHHPRFEPDQDGLGAWARATVIDDGGPLHDPVHAHLARASIGWRWTDGPAQSRGRPIMGEARLIPPPQERWGKLMADWQLFQWFGEVPDFTITISADFARDCDHWSFCALIEHELYHCGQAVDMFGMPRFSRDGFPIFTMRGHDVEEFVDVVARYGTRATGTDALAAAAEAGPIFGQAQINAACGSCLRLVA